jgi:DNA-binding transcriptional regulator GbsR (MarR family)
MASEDVAYIDPISAAVAEAEKEVAEEKAKDAKRQIKAKLQEIERAEKIVANLRIQYDALIRDLRAGGL